MQTDEAKGDIRCGRCFLMVSPVELWNKIGKARVSSTPPSASSGHPECPVARFLLAYLPTGEGGPRKADIECMELCHSAEPDKQPLLEGGSHAR